MKKNTLFCLLTFSLVFLLTEAKGQNLSSGSSSFQEREVLGISIYPNPATEYVFVELSESLKSIELNSLIGNKLDVPIEQVETNKYHIDLKSLTKGYYFIVVRGEDKKIEKATRFLKR